MHRFERPRHCSCHTSSIPPSEMTKTRYPIVEYARQAPFPPSHTCDMPNALYERARRSQPWLPQSTFLSNARSHIRHRSRIDTVTSGAKGQKLSRRIRRTRRCPELAGQGDLVLRGFRNWYELFLSDQSIPLVKLRATMHHPLMITMLHRQGSSP